MNMTEHQDVVGLPSHRTVRAQRWLLVSLAAALFAAGSICGVAAARWTTPAEPPAPNASSLPQMTANRLQRTLDLSDAQREDIEQIIRERQPRIRRIRARIIPEVRRELTEVMQEVSGVLTPQQRQRWRPGAELRMNLLFPGQQDENP